MATVSSTTTTKAVPHRTSTAPSKPSPSTKPQSKLKPIDDHPPKPNPYTYHLTHLTITDPNPLPSFSTKNNKDDTSTLLHTLSRAAAQSLITTLLTTCPIVSTPDGPSITLTPKPIPTISTSNNTPTVLNTPHPLPRRLPLPTPKPKTKWQTFAERKGIKPKSREARTNIVYDEASGEWVKKWGHGGKAHRERDASGGQGEWLVELDEGMVEKEGKMGEGEGVRGLGRRERVERMRRQGRRERRNEGRRGGGGGKGKGD